MPIGSIYFIYVATEDTHIRVCEHWHIICGRMCGQTMLYW